MSAKTLMKNKALGALAITTALTASASTLGCGSAEAMGRSQDSLPSVPTAVAAPATLPVVLGESGAGDYGDGRALGRRNGSILVDRLKQRTTDIGGCGAIPQLERALVSVTRTVRPPYQSGDAFVSGFYSGYVDVVRDTIRDLRYGCDSSIYSSGEFAGQLYGAVACQVRTVSVSFESALGSLEIQPLYSGWSGGSTAVQSSCRVTLRESIQSCASGSELSTDLEAAILVSCSDNASLR